MAMIGKIRRMHHRQKKSVREIARATSLSRNTVRKYLRVEQAEEPQYERAARSTKLAPFTRRSSGRWLPTRIGPSVSGARRVRCTRNSRLSAMRAATRG